MGAGIAGGQREGIIAVDRFAGVDVLRDVRAPQQVGGARDEVADRHWRERAVADPAGRLTGIANAVRGDVDRHRLGAVRKQ